MYVSPGSIVAPANAAMIGATLAMVAPGISEALVATAAGLFAAIPAVIAYNYFLTRIRRTAFRMDTVTVELLAMLPAKTRSVVGVKG